MSMFGALNRFISRLDGEPPPAPVSKIENSYGFQVLRNTNAELPIEPWFDFIVGINGRHIDNGDSSLFATEVRNCAGNSVELGLWSAKGQRSRSMYVPIPADSSSLGLSLQWTSLGTIEDIWHILDVTPNSPADLAGLLPYGDYVIGSPELLLRGESALGEVVEDVGSKNFNVAEDLTELMNGVMGEKYLGKPLRLYVYNHEYNVTRLVTIEPSRTWGGTGALGCVLGYGALHRIPAPLDEPPQDPGETLFETVRMSTDNAEEANTQLQSQQTEGTEPGPPQYLVPAEMNFGNTSDQSVTSKPPTGGSRRHKPHQQHHPSHAMDMDAYLQEGEAKSKEQDFASTPKPAGSIAPPPKGVSKPSEGLSEADSQVED